MTCSRHSSVCPTKRAGSARTSAALTPTRSRAVGDGLTAGARIQPSTWTFTSSPERPTIRAGVPAGRVPSGPPSGGGLEARLTRGLDALRTCRLHRARVGGGGPAPRGAGGPPGSARRGRWATVGCWVAGSGELRCEAPAWEPTRAADPGPSPFCPTRSSRVPSPPGRATDRWARDGDSRLRPWSRRDRSRRAGRLGGGGEDPALDGGFVPAATGPAGLDRRAGRQGHEGGRRPGLCAGWRALRAPFLLGGEAVRASEACDDHAGW